LNTARLKENLVRNLPLLSLLFIVLLFSQAQGQQGELIPPPLLPPSNAGPPPIATASPQSPTSGRRLPEPAPIVLRPQFSAESPAAQDLDSFDPNPTDPPLEFGEELHDLLNAVVRGGIPHTFEDHKKWGRQVEVWAGVRLRREGLRIKTKRRKKLVNDGDWTQHRVTLVNPEEELAVRLVDPIAQPDGTVQFDAVVTAPLLIHTRYTKWVHGVQLLSVSTEARAKVKLRARCELRMRLDPTKLPPDVILDPKVTDADLTLLEFRLDKISKVGGAVANEIGDAAEKVLVDKIEDYRPKLKRKINAAIAKKKDRLRVSLHDLVESQWGEFGKALE